jgi:hypothetical protein
MLIAQIRQMRMRHGFIIAGGENGTGVLTKQWQQSY